jgi:tetratricopeptide (TPR) repeat protein
VDGIKKLIHEVHRRSLWQVLGIFLAASWVVLQVVEVLTETAGLPDWTPTMALVLLLIGLPICLATAFVQEGMPGHEHHRARGPVASDDRAGSVGSNAAVGSGASDADGRAPRGTEAGWDEGVPTAGASLETPLSDSRRLLTWRNAILGGVGAFALLGFSLIAYFVMWTTGLGPVGSLVAQGVLDERDPVLLAEFDNRTSDETLGSVVTDALRVDLLESQVVTLVDDALVSETLRRMGRNTASAVTSEIAREVAVREGIKAVIEGDVSSVGGGYLLAVEIVSAADGSSLAAFRETAESDAELLPAIDRLSQKLRERAGESLRDIRAGEPLEAVTTSSLDALKMYVQAERLYDEGDRLGAIDLLEDAVARDSTFAMAWRKLAVIYSNIGGEADAVRRASSAAYQHRDRLTERERYLAEAYYHDQVTLDYEARADAYRRVLEIQPDDATALNNLAIHYGNRGEWDRAIELYVRAIEGPGRTRNSFNNLGIALYNNGDSEASLETLRQGFELYPLDGDMRAREIRLLWGLGRHEEALESGRAVIRDFPDEVLTHLIILANMAGVETSRGHLDAARDYLEERRALAATVGRPGAVFASEVALARLDVMTGSDSVAAVRRIEGRFDDIFADVPEANRPYGDVAGLWAFLGGDVERARVWSDRALASFPPEAVGSPFYEELLLLIEAFMSLPTGGFDVALTNFREVIRRQNNCDDCYLDVVADAHQGLEQPDSAIVYLERFFAVQKFDFVDAQEAQAADRLTQLAELYEEVGRREDAAATWTRFADRWEDADPVLQPRVAEARARAERLARGGG